MRSSSSSGDGGLVLAGVDRHLEHGVAEAAVAGAVEPRGEVEREDGAGDGRVDDELRPATCSGTGR